MIPPSIPALSSPWISRQPVRRGALRAVLLASSLASGLLACGAPATPIGETEQTFAAGEGDGESGHPGRGTDACADDPAVGDCQVIARGLCFSDPEAACACAGCGLEACGIEESFPARASCPSQGGGSDPDGSTSDDPDAPVSSDLPGGGSNGSTGDPTAGPIGGSPGEPGGGTDGSPGSAGGGSSPGAPGGGSHGSPGCGDGGGGDPGTPACSGGVARDPAGAERCDFIVGDTCFDSAASACACAGCGAERCLVLESYPAMVHCE